MKYEVGDKIEFKTDIGLKIMTIEKVVHYKGDEFTSEIVKYFGKCHNDNRQWQSPHRAITRLIK